MIVVTNEVYVSKYLWSRRGLIYSYHYKNESELQSVQRLRVVHPVKNQAGSTPSRRSTFKRNFRKSLQEAVFEGRGAGGRQ